MSQTFIPISKPWITEKEVEFVTDAVRSTWVSSLGKYIDKFEEDFAKFCDTKYGVALMNGTIALQLALEACGIGDGDEVIVPDLSFIATANAVLNIGAVPVFVDVEPITYCIDPSKIEEAITSKTKAIIPVHLYGHPSEMISVNAIAKKYNLKVVEDAAEAHGATINGKKVGSFGDCAIFSFYGNKNLTTGEGGMVVTNNKEIYDRCRFLRDHAMSKEKRYWHPEKGYNYRMTNLQAALGCAQMSRISEIMANRISLFEKYKKALGGCESIVLNQTLPWATNSYWLIIARFKDISESQRDKLMVSLKEKGIDSRPFFYPMSDMPYFKQKPNTPVTHKVYKEGINLPTSFDLTEEQVNFICDSIKAIVKDLK
ncbi:MAG: aminotransferase DegT [Bacteroidetes bacterium]|nr:MAG: aminotransferase DegT [Bacteroidota bacterium]